MRELLTNLRLRWRTLWKRRQLECDLEDELTFHLAMRDAKKEVQYVVYPDEGHGFVRPENRLHFFAVAEEFLAKHLGGRAEPIGDIKGHTGDIK